MGGTNKALDCQYRNDYESIRFNGSTGTHVSDQTLDQTERSWPPAGPPEWVQEIRVKQATLLREELSRHLESMTAGQRIRMLRTVRGGHSSRPPRSLESTG